MLSDSIIRNTDFENNTVEIQYQVRDNAFTAGMVFIVSLQHQR